MIDATLYETTEEEFDLLTKFFGFCPGVMINFNYIMQVVMKINRTERFKMTIWAGCVDVVDHDRIVLGGGPDAFDGEIIRVNATDESSWIELIVMACIEFIEYIEWKKIKI